MAKTCRRRFSYHQVLLCKYVHLQYIVLIIYDNSQAVPQRQSHDKVARKHAATDRGTPHAETWFHTKLLLCIFIEITISHGCLLPLLNLHICHKTFLKWNIPSDCFRCIYKALIVNIKNLSFIIFSLSLCLNYEKNQTLWVKTIRENVNIA